MKVRPVGVVAVLALLSFGGAACSTTSGGGGVSGPAPQAFVGTWARAVTLSLTCSGTTTQVQLGGNVTIAVNPGGTTIAATAPNGCVANYTIVGSVASEQPGETCTGSFGDAGATLAVTDSTHTLTLSADGKTLAESGNGTAVKTLADGTTDQCTDTSTGTFTKQ
jgi:hypothetical protein